MTEVREAAVADLGGIVSLHLVAFEGYFLSQLGAGFLRVLYDGFLIDPSGILLVAERGARPVGFIAGTVAPQRFFGRLLRRRGLELAVASASALMRSPVGVGRRLVRGLAYRGEKPAALVDAGLLSSVAVHPHEKGTGLGRLLVESFCSTAKQRGCSSVYLTTDRDGNEGTNGFYLAVGFRLESELSRSGGRRMNRYVRVI